MSSESSPREIAFEVAKESGTGDLSPPGRDAGMRHGTAEQEGREVQVFRFVAEGLHQGLRRTFARVID